MTETGKYLSFPQASFSTRSPEVQARVHFRRYADDRETLSSLLDKIESQLDDPLKSTTPDQPNNWDVSENPDRGRAHRIVLSLFPPKGS